MLGLKLFAAKETSQATPKKTQKRNINAIKRNIIAMANSLDVMDEWLDLDEIALIDLDAAVLSAMSLRKSATLKKELIITCDDEVVQKTLHNTLGFEFRQQALDTSLQGFCVFELVWEEKDKYYFPKPVERNYQDFTFKQGMHWYLPDDKRVPDYKAITAIYSPKFNKPMGRSLYQTLFWLVKFKNASLEFWLEYMERFSSPWVVGTTEGDKNEMAENLYAMLAGDVAVVEEEDKVELIAPESKGDFKELSAYADDQIRETLLGSKLMGTAAGQSLASAKEQNQVRKDIAMTDEHILKSLLSQTIDAFIAVNNYSKPITIELKDEDDKNIDLAQRDLNIHQMTGNKLRPTQKYLEDTYKIQLEQAPQDNTTPSTIPNSLLIPNKDAANKDHIAAQLPLASDTKSLELDLVKQIETIFANADTYEEALVALQTHYLDLDTTKVEEMLSTYIANAHLYGLAEVEDENPKG